MTIKNINIKAYSVWSTDDGVVYGALFEPIMSNDTYTVCVIDTSNVGNITSVDSQILTNKIAEFYDFDLFTEYMNFIIKKQE
jgi:hypothetical protein